MKDMFDERLPVPLAKGFMRLAPPSVLSGLIEVFVRRLERLHPRLFQNLVRLDKAVVHIEPVDLQHRFELAMGKPKPGLRLLREGDEKKPDACIVGTLETLLDMLEGRSDGDTEFFTRGITVTGNTSVVVALRNTLDREEISLREDVLSFFGPLAPPAGAALGVLGRLAQGLHEKVLDFHDSLHRTAANPHDLKDECDRLRDEVRQLKARIAETRRPLRRGRKG